MTNKLLLFSILMLFAFFVYDYNYDFRKRSSSNRDILDSGYQEHKAHALETTRAIEEVRSLQTRQWQVQTSLERGNGVFYVCGYTTLKREEKNLERVFQKRLCSTYTIKSDVNVTDSGSTITITL